MCVLKRKIVLQGNAMVIIDHNQKHGLISKFDLNAQIIMSKIRTTIKITELQCFVKCDKSEKL